MLNPDEIGKKVFGEEGYGGARTTLVLEAAIARHKAANLPGIPQEGRHYIIGKFLIDLTETFAHFTGQPVPRSLQDSFARLAQTLLREDFSKEKQPGLTRMVQTILADYKDIFSAIDDERNGE